MIENIKRMRERHDKEINQLQRLCKHKNSKRMPYMWAPGHLGADVEVCDWCGKMLKTYKDGKSVREAIASKPLNNKDIEIAYKIMNELAENAEKEANQ